MSAREQFDDAKLERVQSRIRALEYAFNKVPFLDGVLVEDVIIGSSATQVGHRLGRPSRGFIIVKVSEDRAIGLSAAQPTETSLFVNLEATAQCTANIWFW